ncbi:MAG: hypothetical protein ACYTFZ_08310, partial [Planctomycetota bacterium]
VRSTGSKRPRYGAEIQREALVLVSALREEGFTWAEVTETLTIGQATLTYWTRRAEESQAPAQQADMLPVAVVAGTLADSDETRPRSDGPVVVLPDGVRVEGLDLPEIVELVRLLP